MATKLLALYSAIVSTVLAAMMLGGSAAAAPKIQNLDEVNVHRINVREPDGTLRTVIADRARLPGVIVKGEENPPSDRPQAGMLFYNDEGTENGGLIFSGHKDAEGNVVDSGVSLSFDRYGAGQFVQLAGVDDSMNHIVGLTLSDREPNRTRRRVFVGNDKNGTARVSLMDRDGHPRIILQVAPDGTPSIAFLDANGNITSRIGPAIGQ